MKALAICILLTAPAWGQAKKPTPPHPAGVTAPDTPPTGQPGRYVAIPPQYDPSSGYPNFLWVLDTTTGKVTAYRISSFTEDGKHIAWAVDQLETSGQIALRRMMEPK